MSNDDPQKTVGRTPWDAAVEVARLLGTLTPILIVFAGAIFATYKYLELYKDSQDALNKTRNEARQLYKDELQTANQALRDTTKHMSDLSKQQLLDIESQLELRKKMDIEIEEQRNRLHNAQKQAQQEIQNLEQTKKKYAAFQKEYNSLQQNKQALQNKLIELTSTTKQLENDLTKKKKSISTYGENIEDLVTKLKTISNLIIDGNQEESKKFALSIREIYADPKEILQALTKSPLSEVEKLLITLLGVSEQKLKKAIEQGLGYSLWVRTDYFENRPNFAYIGAVEQKKDIIEKLLMIELQNGKVSDYEYMDYGLIVNAEDVTNWYKLVNYDVDNDGGYISEIAGERYSLAEVLLLQGMIGKAIVGEYEDMEIINLDRFRSQYKSLYESARSKSDDFAHAIRMNERAYNYDAQKEIGQRLYSFPKELSQSIIKFFNAVVNKKEDIAREMLDYSVNPEVLGMIAAIVLRGDFKIISADLTTVDELIQQSAPSENTPVGPVAARLLAQFQSSGYKADNNAEFVFRKNGKVWRLAEFRSSLYGLPLLK